jgi:hypothetical protein
LAAWTCAFSPETGIDRKAALALAETAVARDPKNARALRTRGALRLRMGDPSQALADFGPLPTDISDGFTAVRALFAALSLQQLERTADADRLRDKVENWLKPAVIEAIQPAPNADWNEVALVRILLAEMREAAAPVKSEHGNRKPGVSAERDKIVAERSPGA